MVGSHFLCDETSINVILFGLLQCIIVTVDFSMLLLCECNAFEIHVAAGFELEAFERYHDASQLTPER